MVMSVSILGVLASLGTYSVRSHLASSKSVEAVSMLGSMRANVVSASNGLDEAGLELGRSIAFGKAVAKRTSGSASKSSGSGSSSSSGGGPKNDIDGDGNHGHGNNDGNCDPSNPGSSKNCSGSGSSGASDSGSSGSGSSGSSGSSDSGGGSAVLDSNGKKDVDGDGNNGHGNDVGCDPSNPGNSQGCGKDGDGNGNSGNGNSGNSGNGNSGSSGSGTTGGGDSGGGNPGGGNAGGGNPSGGPTGGGAAGGDPEWANESVRLCGGATPVPASMEDVRGRRYQSSAASWTSGDSNSGWACLKMSRSEPQYYQYGYDVGGSKVSGSDAVEGDGAQFTAWARGDLDGDGRTSWFTLEGKVVDGNLVMAPTINVVDADE
jgi:hypothetical protein